MSSLIDKLNDAWVVDEFFVVLNIFDENDPSQKTLKEYSIPSNSIETLEHVNHGNRYEGILSFKDLDGAGEALNINLGGYVEISYTSQPGSKLGEEVKFNKTFSITGAKSFSSDSSGRNKIIEVTYEDVISKTLKNTFVNKSYLNKKPSEAIKEFIYEFANENCEVLGDPDEKETDLVVPRHIDSWKYLNSEANQRGLSFMQDNSKDSLCLIHDMYRVNDKVIHTGETFSYMPDIQYTRFQVLEYKSDGFDVNKLRDATPTNSSNINLETAKQSEVTAGTKDAEASAGKIGKMSVNDIHNRNIGTRQSNSKTTSHQATITKSINELQKMNIWIPGWAGNRIGRKITVQYPRPAHFNQDDTDELYSGEWVVNKVRDKIINFYYVQELSLTRAGDSK